MERSLQVTFHNLPHSDALEEEVRSRFSKLEQLHNRIVGGRVVIDSPHRNQEKAKTYAVRIELALPGHDLVVSREPVGDLGAALNDAFDTTRRRLRDHVERKRHA